MSSTSEPEPAKGEGESQATPQTTPPLSKTYVKALPINDLADVAVIKTEVETGNVVIAKITPLAKKSVEDVGKAVNELCEYIKTVGGDIARLGEERIVVTPSSIRIWRERVKPPTSADAREEPK